MKTAFIHGFLFAALNAGLLAASAAEAALPADHAQRMTRGLERFIATVAPLLKEQCLKCHGGDATKGDLDLTTREGLIKGGEHGPAVKPFEPSASRLLALVEHREEPHMPSKAPALTAAQVAELRQWIHEGAPYTQPLIAGKPARNRSQVSDEDRRWWAFVPLKRPPVPDVPGSRDLPNPIDRFIQARLVREGQRPAPTADPRTLIRRATLDLIGIPPTPEETAAFLKNPSQPAWDRLVNRLLDSPHHGERWGRHWLDIARFAESSGFEHDYDRPHAYHYRDFVVQALNQDMPYDQFVRWQLAGDELAPTEPLAMMATGFLGAGVFPTQITANEVERTRYDALDDMVSTAGNAFLGLTVGCARCHDHKTDPIPSKDYYRMLATFGTTVRSEVEVDMDPAGTERARAAFEQRRKPLVAALARYESRDLPRKFKTWLAQGGTPMASVPWRTATPESLISRAGATFELLPDGSHLAKGKNGDTDRYDLVLPASPDGASVRWLRLEALAHPSLPKGGPGRADNGNIGLSRIQVFTLDGPSQPSGGGGAAGALAGAGAAVGSGVTIVTTNEVKVAVARASFEQNTDSLSVVSALDTNPKTGWAVDPKVGTNHTAWFELGRPVPAGKRLLVRMEFDLNTRHNLGRFRLAVSGEAEPAPDAPAIPGAVAALLGRPAPRNLTPAESSALLAWWKTTEPGWTGLQAKLAALDREAPKPALSRVLICGEGYPAVRMHTQGADFFPETYILGRGSVDQKRGVANPGVLQVLQQGPDPMAGPLPSVHPQSKGSGRRSALAIWMTDPEGGAGHLLARVMVNRVWQHHFGRGLVATPNDLGQLGARPTHPELLDWLASELIRGGWRLKPLHRLIMNSATYRQAATGDPATVQADPGNLLWSRFTPRRLEAESVRDTLLAIAGTLDRRLGGPGTLDESSHRRSIYFTIKRSRMLASLQAFDLPEPLVSQATRPATTVAPQALLLMNSEAGRSRAREFAARIRERAGRTGADPVTTAYELAVNRPPDARERAAAEEFLRAQAGAYGGEDRAWADLAQVILNLNETIYIP